MLTLIAALSLGQPPVLTPPPVADPPPVRAGSNWVPEKKKELTPAEAVYAEVVQGPVERGEVVWVSVGEDYPDARRNDALEPVLGRGVFKCWREGGRNWMSKVVRPTRPVVNAVQHFVEQRPVLTFLASPLSGG